MFRFGLLSALGLTFAVFLPLSVCPRWLSSGFSAVSSGVGGFSRFRRSIDRLRLSDIAPCAFGRSVLPSAVVYSFLPCHRCCRGFGLWSVAVRWSVAALVIGFIPFAPCQMWVDCLTFSGRSLRLVAVGGFYTFVPSVLSGISLNLSMYRNAVRVLYRSSLGRCPWGVRIWVAWQI